MKPAAATSSAMPSEIIANGIPARRHEGQPITAPASAPAREPDQRQREDRERAPRSRVARLDRLHGVHRRVAAEPEIDRVAEGQQPAPCPAAC